MAMTRNIKVKRNPGDLKCKMLQDQDLGLYIMTFYLLVSFSTEYLEHIYFDPPSYTFNSKFLIAAVQRSRFKQKSPTKVRFSIKII